MALEQLWHVDMSGDVVMIQGMVTDEEADVLVAIRAQHGLEITARVTSHSAVTNRSELMAEIAGLYPGVPASMLACADFDEFLAAVQ